jgi:hypothetical protein
VERLLPGHPLGVLLNLTPELILELPPFGTGYPLPSRLVPASLIIPILGCDFRAQGCRPGLEGLALEGPEFDVLQPGLEAGREEPQANPPLL